MDSYQGKVGTQRRSWFCIEMVLVGDRRGMLAIGLYQHVFVEQKERIDLESISRAYCWDSTRISALNLVELPADGG